MKKIIILFSLWLLLLPGHAEAVYQVGDRIDETLAEQLQITRGVAVVNFFASWCLSCKKEQPLIQGISTALAQRGIRLLGIDTDEQLKEGVAFQKALGLTYPILNDNNQQIVARFGPLGMPAFYYLKERTIVKMRLGAVDQIDQVILSDLKELAP
ncbi:MAG: TlpA family protein disulfide reductase [Magnetococcales bacterium]|nr:TlpA family protein disulfide reductase [Magnetococcales bacterium]NGZ06237.1 TlpA family protein disulfide reductase [Magnetococcales bacterium]